MAQPLPCRSPCPLPSPQSCSAVWLPLTCPRMLPPPHQGSCFAIPSFIMRVPWSFLEATIWTMLVYWLVGFSPSVSHDGRVACRNCAVARCCRRLRLPLFISCGADSLVPPHASQNHHRTAPCFLPRSLTLSFSPHPQPLVTGPLPDVVAAPLPHQPLVGGPLPAHRRRVPRRHHRHRGWVLLPAGEAMGAVAGRQSACGCLDAEGMCCHLDCRAQPNMLRRWHPLPHFAVPPHPQIFINLTGFVLNYSSIPGWWIWG